MSEAKHTPGPLQVVTSDEWPFDINICNANGDVVDAIRLPAHSTRHKSFQDALNCKGFEHSETDKCREANQRALADAHLRAAAPELLEALRWYVETDEVTETVGNEFWLEGRERARAAIANATGEQK